MAGVLRTAGALALALALGALVPWSDWTGAFVPDLPLLAVVALAARIGSERAVPWAVGCGLVADALSATPFGTGGIVFALVAWVAGAAAARVSAGAAPARLVLAALGVAAAELAVRGVDRIVRPEGGMAGASDLLARMAATALVALVAWRQPAPEPVGGEA